MVDNEADFDDLVPGAGFDSGRRARSDFDSDDDQARSYARVDQRPTSDRVDQAVGYVSGDGRPGSLVHDDAELMIRNVHDVSSLSEHRRRRTQWCGRLIHRAAPVAGVQKLVGLHYHCVASPTLLVPTGPLGAGRWNTSPRTTSVQSTRREVSHLLADNSHLLTVAFVNRQTAHFLTKGRTDSPACGGLPQCGAYGLRVAHAAGANDIEGGCRGLIQTDVQ